MHGAMTKMSMYAKNLYTWHSFLCKMWEHSVFQVIYEHVSQSMVHGIHKKNIL